MLLVVKQPQTDACFVRTTHNDLEQFTIPWAPWCQNVRLTPDADFNSHGKNFQIPFSHEEDCAVLWGGFVSEIIISWTRSSCPESGFACVADRWHILKHRTGSILERLARNTVLMGLCWACLCMFALTADTLAQQTAAGVLLEAERAVVPRERAVFQRWAEQRAHRLIWRL